MRGILYEIAINKVISVLDVQFAREPMSHISSCLDQDQACILME